mmetsp:Transcript_2429/g.5344  ORF Transcript_2429/g.5344 Transcript_2429/m.5344 type:complete len:226 (+) Transcript_2429:84-761(+)
MKILHLFLSLFIWCLIGEAFHLPSRAINAAVSKGISKDNFYSNVALENCNNPLCDSSGYFDGISADDHEETILRINFSFSEESSGDRALEAIREYTKSFPFAAILPVQPLTYLPVQTTSGEPAVKVTFLRKKTAEKGSEDGGILWLSSLGDVRSEGMDVIYNESTSMGGVVHLTAKRISKGQTISKIFSEKQIVLAFVKGLSEGRGKDILMQAGIEVRSIFHLWM